MRADMPPLTQRETLLQSSNDLNILPFAHIVYRNMCTSSHMDIDPWYWIQKIQSDSVILPWKGTF